jgi:hypothetical protein
MIERGKHIRLTLKVLDDVLTHKRIGSRINHLLHSNQFYNIRKVQVTGAVNRTHATHPNYILDAVTADQCDA